MNSREKGKRGERQWRDELRANGYAARRGQQFAGSPNSPDVICDSLPWIHFEVKAVERLNVEDAMDQACRDARASDLRAQRPDDSQLSTLNPQPGPKVPIVAHRRSFRPWLVTMSADTFFALLRGDLPPSAGRASVPASSNPRAKRAIPEAPKGRPHISPGPAHEVGAALGTEPPILSSLSPSDGERAGVRGISDTLHAPRSTLHDFPPNGPLPPEINQKQQPKQKERTDEYVTPVQRIDETPS